MPIDTTCPTPSCGKSYQLADESLGKRARCGRCQAVFRVAPGVGELIEAGSGRTTGLRRAWKGGEAEVGGKSVMNIAFSPDGRTAATNSFPHKQGETMVQLWDVQEMRSTGQLKTANFPQVIAFMPDGTTISLGAEVWDVSSLEKVGEFTARVQTQSVDVSRDSRVAMFGTGYKTLYMWDVPSRKTLRTIVEHDRSVYSATAPTLVGFSSDGRTAVSCSADNTIRLWDVATGHGLKVITGAMFHGSGILITPTGQRKPISGTSVDTERAYSSITYVPYRWQVLTGRIDGALCLWDLKRGAAVKTFRGHKGGVFSAVMSPDGRRVFSGAKDGTVCIWNVESGECEHQFRFERMTAVAFFPDGQGALVGDAMGKLRWLRFAWDYEAVASTDWDDDATPILEAFLTLRTPYGPDLPKEVRPNEQQVREALTRAGKPAWEDKDFAELLDELRAAGFGWLRPDGVKQKLNTMAASWIAPPPLPFRPVASESKGPPTSGRTRPASRPKPPAKASVAPAVKPGVAPPAKVAPPGASLTQHHAEPERITHMLVLVDRTPAQGMGRFTQEMLGWLKFEGQPYGEFVDGNTKVHAQTIEAGTNIDEAFISHMALVGFRAHWGWAPDLKKVRYQQFSGPRGNGVTIEVWNDQPGPT